MQNHDQIGNRAFGERIVNLARTNKLKAAMAILLLSPSPPLLFMGEEFGATTPFLFFCDFDGIWQLRYGLAAEVNSHRFEQFNSQEVLSQIPDPNIRETFELSKFDWQSANEKTHQDWLHFYRDLLAIRRNLIVPHQRGIKARFCKVFSQWQDGCHRKLEASEVGKLLTLIANLGKESAGFVLRPMGDLIYSNRPIGSGSEHRIVLLATLHGFFSHD